MNVKEFFSKYRSLIIIILLFSMMFYLRAESVNLSSVPQDMKSFYQDENGLPYFSEMDSYYNYRLTQNFLDNGHLGDTILDGAPWDLHSYYPPGRAADYPPLIVYVTSLVYQIVNLFTTVPLTTVCYWMAAFVASLCVIPAYLFIKKITNDFGGITAAILVGTAPTYFSHTFAGFFDTDMFNMLLPLLVVWFFIESIRAKNMKMKGIYAILSAISMLIFSMAWVGWWYLFYLIIATVVIYLIVLKFFFNDKKEIYSEKEDEIRKEESSIKKLFYDHPEIMSLVIFVVLSSILIGAFFGFSKFAAALFEPFGFAQIQSVVQNTAYPNVYVSVSELQIPSLTEVVYGVGGILPFVLGILSIVLLFRKIRGNDPGEVEEIKSDTKNKSKKGKKKNKNNNVKKDEKVKSTESWLNDERKNYLLYLVLFTLWLIITAYAVTKGVRFIAAFSLPIALGAGIFIGIGVLYLRKYIKNPRYCAIVALLIIAVVSYQSVAGAYTISSSVVPGTDDSMVNSLKWINQNTSNNTVITSWWDFGHLFAAEADRPVTFDGGSQNTPRAYWVGKALVTNNESLSVGILRMLTSSGDMAYLTLDNYTKNTETSVEILDTILGVDKTTAQSILTTQYNLSSDQASNVLQYSHPDNPAPFLFITSGDMVGKAGWWSYFGSWDFDSNQGTQYSYYPAVASAPEQVVNNTTVIQTVNIVTEEAVVGVIGQINGTNITAVIAAKQGEDQQAIEPHKLIIIEDGVVTKDELVSADSPLSILLIKENDTYTAVIMNKELEESMFTKLYFMKGNDLNLFKLAKEEGEVFVWTI
ncbi:MAG: STT3 domain-containing protein [Methanomicrobiales archaeon]